MATWLRKFWQKELHTIQVLTGFHSVVCCISCSEGQYTIFSISSEYLQNIFRISSVYLLPLSSSILLTITSVIHISVGVFVSPVDSFFLLPSAFSHSPFRQHKTKDKHEIDRMTMTMVSYLLLPLVLYFLTSSEYT